MTRARAGGQILPLAAVVVIAGALVVMGLGRLGVAVVDRAGAQTAADAAALAGAAGGEDAAAQLAEANGARLRSYATHEGTTRVEVERRGRMAQARARRVPAGPHCESYRPSAGFGPDGRGQSTPQCSRSRIPSHQ